MIKFPFRLGAEEIKYLSVIMENSGFATEEEVALFRAADECLEWADRLAGYAVALKEQRSFVAKKKLTFAEAISYMEEHVDAVSKELDLERPIIQAWIKCALFLLKKA